MQKEIKNGRMIQIEAVYSGGSCDVLILNLVDASETKTAADQMQYSRYSGGLSSTGNRKKKKSRRWKEEKITASYVGADARQSGTFQGEIILETPNKGDFDGDGMVSYVMIQGDEESIDAEYRTRIFRSGTEERRDEDQGIVLSAW